MRITYSECSAGFIIKIGVDLDIMTSLILCQNISKSYGSRELLSNASFSIHRGDKIGVVGPNGSGKSTLLRILMDEDPADSGEVVFKQGLMVGYVPQCSSFPKASLRSIVKEALSSLNLDEYELDTRVIVMLGKMGFTDMDQDASTLSGGWRKRLELARALVVDPDVLLLDEPTNHLDLESILWLERFLAREVRTYLVISHDRAFLEAACSKMMEISPRHSGGLFCVDGPYSTFLECRERHLEGQESRQAGMSSKMRREAEWLKQTPKARSTKSKSRVDEAHALQEKLTDLQKRNQKKRVDISFASTNRATRKLLVASNIGKSLGGKSLFNGIDLTLTPGMRLGIVGTNGTGKSTLLKILAGEIEPDDGTIKRAEGLKVVHFDQHRAQLPLETRLRDALSPDGETVMFHGKAIHVSGWAKRFLFTSDKLDDQIGRLSGGERARILIARLVLQPADLLLLDEPTNDLDIDTLEILEESLQEFPGAIVLITHDRLMLDEVSTTLIGLGTGAEDQLWADSAQWNAHLLEYTRLQTPVVSEGKAKPKKSAQLSYNEKKELSQIERKIESAEAKIEFLGVAAQDSDATKLQERCLLLREAQLKLDELYARWEYLENKRAGK